MTHASIRHQRRKAAQAPKVRIIDPRERLGPLLERQRVLADLRAWYTMRAEQLGEKVAVIPHGDRRTRVLEHRRTILGARRDVEVDLEDVKEELSQVRTRIKEGSQ